MPARVFRRAACVCVVPDRCLTLSHPVSLYVTLSHPVSLYVTLSSVTRSRRSSLHSAVRTSRAVRAAEGLAPWTVLRGSPALTSCVLVSSWRRSVARGAGVCRGAVRAVRARVRADVGHPRQHIQRRAGRETPLRISIPSQHAVQPARGHIARVVALAVEVCDAVCALRLAVGAILVPTALSVR